jgi:preprotein translocase subunit SecF
VLHGFSFALVIGILIGTYSSIAIAAPILVAYQDWRTKRGARPVIGPGGKAIEGKGGRPVPNRARAKDSKAGVSS